MENEEIILKPPVQLRTNNFDSILHGTDREYLWDKESLATIGVDGFNSAVVIHNVNVIGDAVISDQYRYPIVFLSGNFKSIKIAGGNTLILGGNFKNFEIDGPIESHLHIKGGIFEEGLKVSRHAVFKNDFNIEGGTFHKNLSIESGTFVNALNVIGDSISIDNFKIAGGIFQKKVSISLGVINNSFEIAGGNFSDDIEIDKGEFNGTFSITGKEFSKGFFISGGLFNCDVNISKSKFYKEFKISEGEFHGSFNFNNSIFSGIFISGGVFNKEVSLSKSQFDGSGFEISGGIFNERFNISQGTFNCFKVLNDAIFNKFSLQSGTFNGPFLISGGIFRDDFFIHHGTFSDEFQIINGIFHRVFRIIDGVFSKDFRIGHADFQTAFQVWGGFFKNLFISGGKFDSFKIIGGHFEEKLEIKTGEFQLVQLENATFKEIVFHFQRLRINYLILRNNIMAPAIYLEFAGERNENELRFLIFRDTDLSFTKLIKVKNVVLNCLYFSGITNFSNIVFNGVEFRKELSYRESDFELKFKNLSMREMDFLLQKDVIPTFDTLHFINSDLGKTTFIGCDLEKMKLDFRSSKITDLFLAGSSLPMKITGKDDKQKQLGYAQLKKVYENRGDFVTAQEYYAREMNTLYKQLNSYRNFGEKLNLGLNKISSNHGQNWIISLFSTVIISSIMFSLYCNFIGYTPSWKLDSISLFNFYKCLSHWIEFINPLHKIDFFVSDENLLGNKARVMDGLSRIVLAYFIYQLIQAFRKHGKK